MKVDYTTFFPAGTKPGTNYWWQVAEEDVHQSVFGTYSLLETQQAMRQTENRLYIEMYGDRDFNGGSLNYSTSPLPKERLTHNVCRMCVDTLEAKIAKSKPKSSVLTDGGNWSMQRKAKQLDKFIQGVRYKTNIYAETRRVFRDALIQDLGVLKIFEKDGDIAAERVLPNEILVDDGDAIYSRPRSLYQCIVAHRETLITAYPEFEQKIKDSSGPNNYLISGPHTSDLVQVIEAWHLPSGKDSGDGRHVLAVSQGALVDEEWKRKRFPFEFYRWSERHVGFYGQGVVEQLRAIQRNINRALRTIWELLRKMPPKYWIHDTATLPTEHMTSEIGIVLKSNEPPQVIPGIEISQSLFGYYNQQVARAFELIGVSQLSVASKKPSGIDSGVGLRELNDTESERFAPKGQAWEEFHVAIDRQFIELAREMAEAGRPITIGAQGKRGLEEIKWKDVDMDEDAYYLKAYPASSLPTTPGARKQYVLELKAEGMITDPLVARRLLDLPDLEHDTNMELAGIEDIENAIESIIDDGKYIPPESFQDLNRGVIRFTQAYLWAKQRGAPGDVLTHLQNWILSAQTILALARQPPPPSPQEQAMAPNGVTLPPEMVAQIPQA